MKRKFVQVTWDDAHVGTSGWNEVVDATREGSKVCKCDTFGYMLVDTPEVVTIAGTVSYDKNTGEVDQVNGVMTIPRQMVRKIRTLK
jgi:hypothetical protein